MSQSPKFDILLVDDSAADARIFEASLLEGSIRARVYWVASGEEAVQFLARTARFRDAGPVKIVVLDLHLPGQDGFETLRQIKGDPTLNRIPVILMSSSTAQDEIDLAYSLGANGFFRKPTTLDSCILLVRTIAQYWLDFAQLPTPLNQAQHHQSFEDWQRGKVRD